MENKQTALWLAPMAGGGDRAFRESCAAFGADHFCTEMISAKAYHFRDKKTEELAVIGEIARPSAIQLFGSEPLILAEAAAHFSQNEACAEIDLNFGCPVPKIVNNKEGSALLRDPARCREIVRAVVAASKKPVTVKLRTGWTKDEMTAPQIASICEEEGAALITVHGRAREDFYRDNTVSYRAIRAVKEAVKIPVVANGDIRDGESARRMLEETGCDALMIGRAALGSPWVFAEIRAALNREVMMPFSKKEVIRKHLELAFLYKPEAAGREMRYHLAQYLKGFRGAASLRDRACRASKKEEYLALLDLLEE